MVFSEHGILQLASVLRSQYARAMSIQIIEVFIKMSEILLTKKDLLIEMENIRKKVLHHDEKIDQIFQYLQQFMDQKSKPRKRIGFK
jgi:hypothetical protein